MPDVTQLPLRDIHLPGPVAWWPPAPGWWLIATVLVAAAIVSVVLRYRSRHRRAALRAVRGIAADLEAGAEPVECLQRLSMIMRRYAITVADNRARAAGLTGQRWLEYLDTRWAENGFATGAGRLLTTAPYGRPASVRSAEALDLTVLCGRWIAAQPLRRTTRRRRGLAPLRRHALRGSA